MFKWLNDLIEKTQREIHQQTLDFLPFPERNFYGTGVPLNRAKVIGDAFRAGDEEKYFRLISQEIDSAHGIGRLIRNNPTWGKGN